jgi:[pyruvate, water dikinase]-phosphate phosphotransferase / [pyruvate, water dikinase] kinase
MKTFHLHLISDATGETLNAIAVASLSQFEGVDATLHPYTMIRSEKQMVATLAGIAKTGGLVMFTLVSADLRTQLEVGCRTLEIPSVAILDPAVGALQHFLNAETSGLPGQQHQMDAEYFGRIDAIQYTLAHDDGMKTDDLHHADIILVGVSRTSKTPTCMYLANRGLKVANIPIVPGIPLPPEMDGLTKVLIIGLTTTADRLVHVRKSRLRSMAESGDSDYADPEAVEDEVAAARRSFNQKGWPIIDVTRRSIEESAAAISNLYQRHLVALAHEEGRS